MLLQSRLQVQAELDEMEALLRSKTWRLEETVQRRVLCSAIDTLRWVLRERGILRPAELVKLR